MDRDEPSNNTRLRAPRAAAMAGIVFSILLGISLVLTLVSLPSNLQEGGAWLASSANNIFLSLNLIPFVGIAFLWFKGVLNDRAGERQDRFLVTVSMGSGLLFLALLFVFAALVSSSILLYVNESDPRTAASIYAFGSLVATQIMNIYVVRMAGVFIISTSSLFMRTRMIPSPFIWLGYAFAILMLLWIGETERLGWVILLFPLWVLLISIYILTDNYRKQARTAS